MKEITLDCMGLPCPQPVLKCKQTLEADRPDLIIVQVDNPAASENVARFLCSQGYTANAEEISNGFQVVGTLSADACTECTIMTDKEIAAAAGEAPAKENARALVFISSDTIGSGDDDLGGKLMKNFLLTLPEMGATLWRIILVNGGVKLSAEGHDALTALTALEQKGVSILVCGTCLEHFDLLEAKQVGETTNMLDVVTSLDMADKVISI